MKRKVLVYTALFNLSRQDVDGRSITQYLEWLRKTAQIFPGLVVFHDGSCDGFKLEEVELIKIEKSELFTFKLLTSVKELLHEFKPLAASDLTFVLPEYALMQFSKFELANRLLKLKDFESILWVDAGISRFIEGYSVHNSIDEQKLLQQLLDLDYQFAFEVDLRRNLTWPKFKVQIPVYGSCRRIVSGTSFWIRRDGIHLIWLNSQQHLKFLIQNGVWDNEQVYLREFLGKSNCRVAFVLQSKSRTGTLARVLLGERLKMPLGISRVLSHLLAY